MPQAWQFVNLLGDVGLFILNEMSFTSLFIIVETKRGRVGGMNSLYFPLIHRTSIYIQEG